MGLCRLLRNNLGRHRLCRLRAQGCGRVMIQVAGTLDSQNGRTDGSSSLGGVDHHPDGVRGRVVAHEPAACPEDAAVDDVDKRLEALKQAGGKIHREPFDVPGVGRIAMIEVPGGAAQGWMTPAEAPD